jgi:hypothetical protein
MVGRCTRVLKQLQKDKDFDATRWEPASHNLLSFARTMKATVKTFQFIRPTSACTEYS